MALADTSKVFTSKITEQYAIYHGDCCEVLPTLRDESIHMSLYSPPFGGMLYQYSSDPADLSNSRNYDEFFEHYRFIIRELHRLTLPGRMTVVHCTDIFKSSGGKHSLIDFPGHIIAAHIDVGWAYVARIHIWKEPLTVRNRTMLKSLHHKTLVEDSTTVSIANADYLCVFRRSGENPIPVTHEHGLLDYAGSKEIPDDVKKWRGHSGNQINNAYSQWIWRQYASSNWDDIRIDRTLGSGASLYSFNRADKDGEHPDEKHMHPLQLDVIDRAAVLWSNPGEVVLTPFMGVGSEVCGALMNRRKAVGIELKPAYYRQALINIKKTKPAAEERQQILIDTAEHEPLDIRKHAERGNLVGPVAQREQA